MNLPTFGTPPIGPQQGKIWGTTRLLFAHYGVECHCIHFKAGAFCSVHYHKHKWNRFVGLSGEMVVRIFPDGGGMDETRIRVGQVTDVPPGVHHQFEGIEEGEALEVYWVSLSPEDIERRSQGGTKDDP